MIRHSIKEHEADGLLHSYIAHAFIDLKQVCQIVGGHVSCGLHDELLFFCESFRCLNVFLAVARLGEVGEQGSRHGATNLLARWFGRLSDRDADADKPQDQGPCEAGEN